LLSACAAAPPPGPTAAQDPGPEPARCEPIDVARGERAFGRAETFLEYLRQEEHPERAVFERGLRDLEEAAAHGSLEGQHRFGSVVFGFAFTDHAPEPRDEADYVRAFAFLRVAARRGHPRVLESFPGLDGAAPEALRWEEPLTHIPRPWLERAFARADAWWACAPDAAKTPWVAPPAPPRTELRASDMGWVSTRDPEGPLLRVTDADDGGEPLAPPLTTRWLAALPDLHGCYAEWLRRDSGVTTSLTFAVTLPGGGLELRGAADAAFLACARTAAARVVLPTDASRRARLAVAFFPRALSAPGLPSVPDGANVQRWEADASCWTIVKHPCAPNKMCMAPTRERVRCGQSPE
jgi:hypothetical protein